MSSASIQGGAVQIQLTDSSKHGGFGRKGFSQVGTIGMMAFDVERVAGSSPLIARLSAGKETGANSEVAGFELLESASYVLVANNDKQALFPYDFSAEYPGVVSPGLKAGMWEVWKDGRRLLAGETAGGAIESFGFILRKTDDGSTFRIDNLTVATLPVEAAGKLPKTPAATPVVQKKAPKGAPNIILIFSDDVGFEEIGCYGVRDEPTKTPNIDRLGERGTVFKTCWAQAICGPSRAMLYTGKYAINNGEYDNKLRMAPDGGTRLKNHRETLPNLTRTMHDAGYTVAFAGKWHHAAYNGRVHTHHAELGIDTYMETGTNPAPYEKLLGRKLVPDDTWEHAALGGHPIVSRYWKPGIIHDGKVLETTMNDYGPDMLSDFICEFIRDNAKGEKPFLAVYPMNLAHSAHCVTPIEVAEGAKASNRHFKKGKPEGRAIFDNQVRYMDRLIGKIIKQVEDAGIADNTLIIYSSDNGTTSSSKSKGVEYGVHVPFVVAGAGVESRGMVDQLMDFTDVLPTLADFAGSPMAEGVVDGISLKPFLSGKSEKTKPVIYSFPGPTRLVRTGEFLLEAVCPLYGKESGRFYKTNGSFDGKGYENITHNPEFSSVRQDFQEYLNQYPTVLPGSFEDSVWKKPEMKQGHNHFTNPKHRKNHLALPLEYRFYDPSF
jgi:arylsulfatase A-like enzyme